jgi:hypothetical protein
VVHAPGIILTLTVFAGVIPQPASGSWRPEGVRITPESMTATALAACTDGAGGALVVWKDQASAAMFAQHLLRSGELDPGWPSGGVSVGLAPTAPLRLEAIADSSGGLYVIWQQGEGVDGRTLRVARVAADGTLAAGWPAGGHVLFSRYQDFPNFAFDAVADGQGGLYIAHPASRAGTGDYFGIQIARYGPNGPGTTAWGAPRRVTPEDAELTSDWWPRIAPDAEGGVFVAWGSLSWYGVVPNRYRLLHLMANGSPAPGWPAGGMDLDTLALPVESAYRCTAPPLSLCEDGRGGVFFMTHESFDWSDEMRLRRLSGDGLPSAGWLADGITFRGFFDYSCEWKYTPPTVRYDRCDGALVGIPWTSTGGTSYDVHRVDAMGATVQPIASVWSANGAEFVADGSRGTYLTAFESSTRYCLQCSYCSFMDLVWGGGASPGSNSLYDFTHCGPSPLDWFTGVALVETGDGGVIFVRSETQASVGIVAARGNPTHLVTDTPRGPSPGVSFHLRFERGRGLVSATGAGFPAGARIEVLDITGRRLASSSLGAGSAAVGAQVIPGTRDLPAGVYWARLTTPTQTIVARAVVLP